MVQDDKFLGNSAIVFYLFPVQHLFLSQPTHLFSPFSGHFYGSQLSDELIDLDVANQSPYEEEKYAEIFSFSEKKLPVRVMTVEDMGLN